MYKQFTFLTIFLLILTLGSGCKSNESTTTPFQPENSAKEHLEEKANSGAEDAKEPNFALISPDQPIVVGAANKVTVEIQPRNGLKINEKFPWKVRFKSKENLHLDEVELDQSQLEMTEKSVKITLDVMPSDAGTFDLEGVGTFSVCGKSLCDVRRNEPLLFTVIAEPEA